MANETPLKKKKIPRQNIIPTFNIKNTVVPHGMNKKRYRYTAQK
jgi:hypothetical protein